MNKVAIRIVGAALAGSLWSAQATAAIARPVVELHLGAQAVKETPHGELYGPISGEVQRGSVIRYTITATNSGSDPARKLTCVGKVPNGTEFVSGSAKAPGAKVEYSLDAGRTWSATPTYEVRSATGLAVRYSDPRRYSRVRFIVDKPLAPHAVAQYSYEVRVK